MHKRILAAGLLMLASTRAVSAGELPVTDTTAPVTEATAPVTAAAAVARLDAMQAVLDARRSYANTWFYGWTAAYAVGTVAQGALYYSVDEDEKPGYLVGTATAALAVGGMIISPVKSGSVADRFRELRAAGRADRAGALFEETADGEREARNWFNHGLSAAVGLGSGAILLWGYDQPGAAIFQTVSSLVVGELQILTGPTDAADAREHWLANTTLGAGPDRLAVTYRF